MSKNKFTTPRTKARTSSAVTAPAVRRSTAPTIDLHPGTTEPTTQESPGRAVSPGLPAGIGEIDRIKEILGLPLGASFEEVCRILKFLQRLTFEEMGTPGSHYTPFAYPPEPRTGGMVDGAPEDQGVQPQPNRDIGNHDREPQDRIRGSAYTCSLVRKWNTRFDGLGDPVSFMERLEELMESYGVGHGEILNVLPELLHGEALLWYRNERETWHNYHAFKRSFELQFTPLGYRQRLEEEIRCRTQGEQEPFRSFVVALATLMRRQGGLSLAERLDRIFANMKPAYKLTMRRSEIYTVEEMIRQTEHIEAYWREKELFRPPPPPSLSLVPETAYHPKGQVANSDGTWALVNCSEVGFSSGTKASEEKIGDNFQGRHGEIRSAVMASRNRSWQRPPVGMARKYLHLAPPTGRDSEESGYRYTDWQFPEEEESFNYKRGRVRLNGGNSHQENRRQAQRSEKYSQRCYTPDSPRVLGRMKSFPDRKQRQEYKRYTDDKMGKERKIPTCPRPGTESPRDAPKRSSKYFRTRRWRADGTFYRVNIRKPECEDRRRGDVGERTSDNTLQDWRWNLDHRREPFRCRGCRGTTALESDGRTFS